MKEPRWIDEGVTLAIHQMQIDAHGGASGVRDRSLLESALARPRQIFAYGERVTKQQLAAAYAAGIAKNHPFLDGNKRTAWVVCALFLERNGIAVTKSQEEVVAAMLGLASGEITEASFEAWLKEKRHSRRARPSAE